MSKLSLAVLKILALISLKMLNSKTFDEIFKESPTEIRDLINWMIVGDIIADEKTEIKLAKALSKGIRAVVWHQEDDTTTATLIFKGGQFKTIYLKGNVKLM